MNNSNSTFEYVKQKVDIIKYAKNNLAHAKQPRGSFVCPSCGSGSGYTRSSDSALSIDKDKQKFYCHACHVGGDIFDLAGIINHTSDKKEQLKIVADYEGITLDESISNRAGTFNQSNIDATPKNAIPTLSDNLTKQSVRDAETAKIKKWQEAMKDEKINSPAVEYLAQRGFNREDIEAFNLGYDAERKRIIIPSKGCNYYHFDRDITGKANIKLLKPKNKTGALSQPIYNPDALNSEVVVIVEGQFDALTLVKLGIKNVIATGGGIATLNQIIEKVKNQNNKPAFLLFFDKEEKANKFTTDAIEQLKGVTPIAIDIRDKFSTLQGKDANDIYLHDADALSSILKAVISETLTTYQEIKNKALEKTLEAYNVTSIRTSNEQIYYQTGLSEPIPTKYRKLDEVLGGGLHPKNLITMGAVSSCGKTSFMLLLAHNIALQKIPALYVSIEESKIGLNARLLSYYEYLLDKKNALPYLELMHKNSPRNENGNHKILLEKAIENLENNVKDYLYIMECEKRPSVNDVKEVAKVIAQKEKIPPVVFIDYLQLLKAVDARNTDKQTTDFNLTELKYLGNELNTPVMCISSLNRDGYTKEIEFESFKESGLIEYSSDIVLGLQPANLKKEITSNTENQAKKEAKDAMKKYQSAINEDVAIRVLKNRYGRKDYEGIKFEFRKCFNYFKEL